VLFYSGMAMGFLHGDALPRRALKKAKRTLAAHPQFVAWQDASSETEFGYGLR
jgi:hypothetical protein